MWSFGKTVIEKPSTVRTRRVVSAKRSVRSGVRSIRRPCPRGKG